MILTIDTVPVLVPEPLQTVSCILCGAAISFVNKDPLRFFKHLQDHHQVHLNHNLLLSINLIDHNLVGKVISSGCQSLKELSDDFLKPSIQVQRNDISVGDEILKQENDIDDISYGDALEIMDSKNEIPLGDNVYELSFDEDNKIQIDNKPNLEDSNTSSEMKTFRVTNAKIKESKEKVKYPYCEKSVPFATALSSHIQKHHGSELSNEILLCAKCGFSTYTFGEYGQHKKTCDSVCEVCQKIFPNKYLLKGHVERIHEHKESIITVCPHCGLSSKSTSMYDHILRYHSDQRFKCPDCEYTNPNNTYVKRHYKHVHAYVITKCEDCGKEVKRIEDHKVQSCSARKNKKTIECDQCDKTFGTRMSLKRHIKNIHMDIKDNFCSHCDYKSHSRGNLKVHISRVHEGNSVKTACNYCDKNVSTSGMEWHIKTYHTKLQNTINNCISDIAAM